MRNKFLLTLNCIISQAIMFCWQAQAAENLRPPIIDIEGHIEELALQHGPFSDLLYAPVMTLAKLYLNADDLELATDSLHRAQNIAHRNDGVYTAKQSDAIIMLSQIALKKADYRTANLQQKFAFFIQSRHFSRQDPKIILAYSEMANWYMQTGQTQRSRHLLKDGIEKAKSLNVDPLPLAIEMSRARRLGGICCVSKELLELVEDSATSDLDTLAKAYLEIADTYILAREEELATNYFLKASEVSSAGTSVAPHPISARKLITGPQKQIFQQQRIYRTERGMFNGRRLTQSTREDLLEDIDSTPQWFIIDWHGLHQGFILPDRNTRMSKKHYIEELVGKPILFSKKQLDNVIPLRLKKRSEELKVEVTFTVTEKGNLEDIEVINSTAPIKLNRLVTSALQKTHYRPGLVDGRPVTTKNVQFIQTFSYDHPSTL